MKTYYEEIPETKLMRRTPVIIPELMEKLFILLQEVSAKPLMKLLIKSMQETTKYLCENIQGCVFGYTQSDEIYFSFIRL